MTCKRGEIVLIPFPYSDLQSAKRRPVLVLAPPDRHGDFIGLAITSVRTGSDAIQIDSRALTSGMLPKTSWIRLDKIFTLSGGCIVKSLGVLSEQVLESALHGLCQRVGYAK